MTNQFEGQPDLLLWTDCEFTGLSVAEGHKIIEIGTLVTTVALQEIDAYQSFIKYDWSILETLMQSNPWWDGRDDDKHRMQTGTDQGREPNVVDADLAHLVDVYFQNYKPPLFGNSVHSDKKHIDAELPEFSSRLDYRLVDITSFKLIAGLYTGVGYTDKVHPHYALDDIRESVDEFRFLLNALGIADVTTMIDNQQS